MIPAANPPRTTNSFPSTFASALQTLFAGPRRHKVSKLSMERLRAPEASSANLIFQIIFEPKLGKNAEEYDKSAESSRNKTPNVVTKMSRKARKPGKGRQPAWDQIARALIQSTSKKKNVCFNFLNCLSVKNNLRFSNLLHDRFRQRQKDNRKRKCNRLRRKRFLPEKTNADTIGLDRVRMLHC